MATSNNVVSMYIRYFIYSDSEHKRMQNVYGANYTPGTVVVRGVAKPYTSIVSDPTKMSTDAIVVTKGDIRKIKYSEPTK
jgi:hypothetical protein